jgi:hypothetical protein
MAKLPLISLNYLQMTQFMDDPYTTCSLRIAILWLEVGLQSGLQLGRQLELQLGF